MQAAVQGLPPPVWQRRLLAVLVADCAGYSRLMETDELGTHTRMRSLRVGLIDPCVVTFRGEIVKNTGDGFLACFESPLDATRCAVSLQHQIALREAGHPPESRIAFRMGLNVEDVIVEKHDVFGAGVNIAARLQEWAAPGGVVISSGLRELLGDDLPYAADDLGELVLKNISKSVRAFALALPGADRIVASVSTPREDSRVRLPTLAIRPLRNLSLDPAGAYFGNGVIEDLIVTLSGLSDVFVISRGSTLGFRPRTAPEAVSQRLGVRYVLGGSVRREAKRLRFTFELTDVELGSILWADRYECALPALFDLQDHIAERIVGSIASHVRKAEITRALRKRPDTMDGYDHLLQALNLLYRLDYESFSQARVALDRAIEADADYAAAYAYAAKWHIFKVGQGWSNDPQADGREAIRLAALANERDPYNSLALAVHGHAQGMLLRDYDAAIELLERSLASSPGNPWAWILSSPTYGYIGDAASGIARAERAIRLSPIDQHAFYYFCLLAQNHYLNDNFDDAVIWAKKSLRHNMRFNNAIRIAAASFVAQGRFDEARQAATQLMQVQPRFTISGYARHCPFKDPQVVSTYLERLRSAGLPD